MNRTLELSSSSSEAAKKKSKKRRKRSGGVRMNINCRKLGGWKSLSARERMLEHISVNHPRMRTTAMTPDWWKKNITTCYSKLLATCTLCNAESKPSITNLQRGQGFGCACLYELLTPNTFEKSFASYEGKAPCGTFKRNCLVGDVDPRSIFKSSDKKYQFKCPDTTCGHTWLMQINSVTRGSWCCYCSGRQLCPASAECKVCISKSFYSYEGKAKCGTLKRDCLVGVDPRGEFRSSNKKYKFKCPDPTCGHTWSTRLCHITHHSNWCPYCSGRQLCPASANCSICIAKSFYSYDGLAPCGTLKRDCLVDDIDARSIFRSSNREKYKFKCPDPTCRHVWSTTLNNLNHGYWCPYCSNPPRKICPGSENCSICIARSFYRYEGKAPCGTLKRNCIVDDIDIQGVFRGTYKKYQFKCPDPTCGHTWSTSLYSITSKGTWCPYCAGQKLCPGSADCKVCIEKSFASYDNLAPCGTLKRDCIVGDVDTRGVRKGTETKYKFKCPDPACGHVWSTTLNKVNYTWCPYCAGKKICPVSENCKVCTAKSFASYDGLAPCGTLKRDCLVDDIDTRGVSKGTAKKYKFKCPDLTCGHTWSTALCSITGSRGGWCPACRNKTETFVQNSLFQIYKDDPTTTVDPRQGRIPVDGSKRKLKWDHRMTRIINGEEHICNAETDGDQHTNKGHKWSTEKTRASDVEKQIAGRDAGQSLVRLDQEWVWKNRDKKWMPAVIKAMFEAAFEAGPGTLVILDAHYEKYVASGLVAAWDDDCGRRDVVVLKNRHMLAYSKFDYSPNAHASAPVPNVHTV